MKLPRIPVFPAAEGMVNTAGPIAAGQDRRAQLDAAYAIGVRDGMASVAEKLPTEIAEAIEQALDDGTRAGAWWSRTRGASSILREAARVARSFLPACHCGKPIHVHADLDGFTRGLCEDCDAVRCDAYPGACS